MPALKLLDQDIAHADAHTRVVVADASGRLDAVAQYLHLVGHGHVAQHQYLAGDEHVPHPLQCPADRRVVGASKVDAQAQVQLVAQVDGRVAGHRGTCRLSRGDQVVGQQHVAAVQEFAHVLLSPTNGVVQGFAELVDVDREAILHCLGDGHHMAGPVLLAALPGVKQVVVDDLVRPGATTRLAVGGSNEADLFLTAPEGIGDGWEHCTPRRIGVLEKCEFRQHQVGAKASHGIRPAGDSQDAAAVVKRDGAGLEQGVGAVLALNLLGSQCDAKCLRPLLALGQRLHRLALGGGCDHPGGLGPDHRIPHRLGGRAKILTGLTGPDAGLKPALVRHPLRLVRQQQIQWRCDQGGGHDGGLRVER
nr:MAG TPA: hypothetical protein [Bacteriophage sp.]